MPIVNRIAEFHAEMTAWRRDLHANPEAAFEEVRTGETVAAKLASWGIDVHRGLAKTGVVGVIRAGGGAGAIGLRADMDALKMDEKNDFPHASGTPGRMHACGHDGHTTMLLGAAKYLAETRNFDGTVYLIFQPAEETEGGGRVMVEEGLFEKFPVDAVYGMHNMPTMPLGMMAINPGAMMAASDSWEILVRGQGCHAAKPHTGIDPTVIASHVVIGLQSLVSRNLDPLETAVVSVTQMHAGSAWNVTPDDLLLRGTCRTFKPEVRGLMERRIGEMAAGIAAAHGGSVDYRFIRRYPPTVNHAREAEKAARAASRVVGPDKVDRDLPPSTGGEDFSFMLQARPGAYIWLGSGPARHEGRGVLHNPYYDFNDEALPLGASYWVSLVEQELAKTG
ncbi:MAG: amidohydrolase [Alphaproteobacteria bacterium]|nr:amidohydrolase [Alphaproteobacteria bacterium]